MEAGLPETAFIRTHIKMIAPNLFFDNTSNSFNIDAKNCALSTET